MSNATPIKLNLKALQKPETLKKETEIVENITKSTLKESSKMKISIPQVENTRDMWEEVLPVSPSSDSINDTTAWINQVSKQKEEDNEKSYIKLDSINKYVAKKAQIREQKKEDQREQKAIDDKAEQNIKTETSNSDSEIHFNNYTSHFEKQSKNVFKKIRNFSYAPKTRSWFLIMLIFLSWFSIIFLMMLFPEKHSFTLYKASILEIYNQWWITKWEWSNDSTINQFELDDLASDNSTSTPENDNLPPAQTTETDEATRKSKLQEHLLNKYSN